MKSNSKYILGFLLISLLLAEPGNCLKKHFSKQICKGIRYIHIIKGKNTQIHILKVDLNQPNIEVKPALAQGKIRKLDTVSSIAEDNQALAAINGSFFDQKSRLPVGLLMIDGTLISKSLLYRSAFGITYGKKPIFGVPYVLAEVKNLATQKSFQIWGINRPRKADEVILYSSDYGKKTETNSSGVELIIENNEVVGICEGNSDIPPNGCVLSFHGWSKEFANQMGPGTNIFVHFKFFKEWEDAFQIITGGPRLLEDGRLVAQASVKEEYFGSELLKRNARTAVGVTKNNELILAVVEGKKGRGWRRGASFTDLAQIMLNAGCLNAIALDGGGTSTLYIDGKVVNRLSDDYERRVSNALVVKLK